MYNLIQQKREISNGVTGTEEEVEEKKVNQADLIFNAAMNIFGDKLK